MGLRVLAVLLAIFIFITAVVAAVCGYGWWNTLARLERCEAAACKAAVEELAAIKAAGKRVAPKPKPAPTMAPCAPPRTQSRCLQEDPILRDACERVASR